MIIAFVTFVIYELIKVWQWKLQNGERPFFYLLDPNNNWNLLLDIFTGIVKYFMLFLLIVILWIMIKLTLIENELNKEKYTVTIDIFDSHEVEELKHLRSYILSMLSNYIIVISLFVISDINFFKASSDRLVDKTKILISLYPFESIMVILMLLIGIILFITTQKMIQKIIDKGATLELAKIYRIYKEIDDKVCETCFNKRHSNNINELEEHRIILDILEKEETRIRQIQGKMFDNKLLITILATLIIPIISIVIEAWISLR
jgi:hypothetical protein